MWDRAIFLLHLISQERVVQKSNPNIHAHFSVTALSHYVRRCPHKQKYDCRFTTQWSTNDPRIQKYENHITRYVIMTRQGGWEEGETTEAWRNARNGLIWRFDSSHIKKCINLVCVETSKPCMAKQSCNACTLLHWGSSYLLVLMKSLSSASCLAGGIEVQKLANFWWDLHWGTGL